ncbi:hypothetical protein SAMN05421766_102137 [Zobellia uliginosa]|uniref:Uncharacterized protein n=1 Tax=Zobellia uliginosa TaxID=143224 RepID=A0ABY1KQA3_9FLAO|nr:hypothetical protein [Zobellia uliginosa]SIS47499.1 hypothetical protein SAMN05421766_102137 [Zobellia uliginosa]
MNLKIIVFITATIMGCKNNNQTKIIAETQTSPIKIENNAIEVEIDTALISKKLAVDNIYNNLNLNNVEISIPFQYSIKLNKESNAFEWDLYDLFISDNSSGYSQYELENNIPYDGNSRKEGKIHFVETHDSTAITTEKFKDLNKAAYKKIYYSDKESIIYEDTRNNIAVIRFRYLKEINSFAIYSKTNESFFSNASKADILDLSICQLRMAKNLFKGHKTNKARHWNTYKKSLSNLESKKLKNTINLLISSIDTLATNASYSFEFGGNIEVLSIMKTDSQVEELWRSIHKIPKNNFIDFHTLNSSDITDNIAFLRARENYIKTEFVDSSSVILLKKPKWPNSFDYAILKKTRINENDILLYTGGQMNYGRVNSKEIAYFYNSLLNNYHDL